MSIRIRMHNLLLSAVWLCPPRHRSPPPRDGGVRCWPLAVGVLGHGPWPVPSCVARNASYHEYLQ